MGSVCSPWTGWVGCPLDAPGSDPHHQYATISEYLQPGLPWCPRGKESACQCRKRGFDPWVGKIPSRGKRQSTPVFLPGNPHAQRSLVGYSPWGCKRVRHNLVTKEQLANTLTGIFASLIKSQFSKVSISVFYCKMVL